MRTFYLLFLTLGLSVFSFGQEERIQKADKILNSARNAIYKDVKLSDVKSFQAEKEITGFGEMEVIQPGKSKPQKMKAKVSMKKEVLASFPDRIKSLNFTFLPIPQGLDGTETYLKAEIIANGKRVSVNEASVFDGQETDFESSLNSLPLSGKEKKKRLEEYKKLHALKETLPYVHQQVWVDVFPAFLFFPWDAKKQFKYLGKAKIGEKRADILELVATEKEKAEAGNLRLFFDENTHLLLMATADVTTPKGSGKAKYFFSDYQVMDGILIAKKVNTEASISGKDGNKQRTVQRIIIKEFKLNPVFKAGTFEVKK